MTFVFPVGKLLKGKGNIERKYVYEDRTFQAKKFDTSLTKINQQIKLLEFKYVKPTDMEAASLGLVTSHSPYSICIIKISNM